MPTHRHPVLWLRTDGRLTLTHRVRWHKHHRSTGSRHVYQNRFKAFPMHEDENLYAVPRYVERNALRRSALV